MQRGNILLQLIARLQQARDGTWSHMVGDRMANELGLALGEAAGAGKVTGAARLLDSGAPIRMRR